MKPEGETTIGSRTMSSRVALTSWLVAIEDEVATSSALGVCVD